jgi:hypothetical protein
MAKTGKRRAAGPAVMAQRSRFLDAGAEFFVIAMARPLVLTDGASSSVSLGFLVDDALRERVRFCDDPAVPRVDVNLTCERCRLSPAQCRDRAAPPLLHQREESQVRKEEALRRLLSSL